MKFEVGDIVLRKTHKRTWYLEFVVRKKFDLYKTTLLYSNNIEFAQRNRWSGWFFLEKSYEYQLIEKIA